MNQVIIETPDIQKYRSHTDKLVEAARTFTITSAKDVEESADILHNIKLVEKAVIEKKEEITKPLMASLAATRDLFKPFEEAFDSARKMIKRKIIDFNEAEQQRIAAKNEKLAARVAKGTMTAETAAQKMDAVGQAKTSVSGSVGAIQTRKITKVRVIDEAAIPREYLVPDISKITIAVLQENKTVPGTEKYTETIIASR